MAAKTVRLELDVAREAFVDVMEFLANHEGVAFVNFDLDQLKKKVRAPREPAPNAHANGQEAALPPGIAALLPPRKRKPKGQYPSYMVLVTEMQKVGTPMSFAQVRAAMVGLTYSPKSVGNALHVAKQHKLVTPDGDGGWKLTAKGAKYQPQPKAE